MNYTKIRQLIYRERQSLDDFNVLAEEKNVLVNAFLYDRILKIYYLHPMYDYANEETLRIFNDVHFFMTLFFHDENPLVHYADYRRIPNPNQKNDDISQNRTWVELSMIYVILERWNRTKWFKKNLRYVKFFEIIKGEVENYSETWMGSPSEDVAYIITDGCEFRDFIMSIDNDFPLRDIREIIDSGESLRNCLFAGGELREVVDKLCKDNEKKIQLIDRLLEPEKEHYGDLDSTVWAAYRSLYELKSELTGEPLPKELPFEKAGICTPPMMATPPSFLDYQKENKTDNRDARIAELEKEVRDLKDKLSKFEYADDKDIEQLFYDDKQGEPQEDKQPKVKKLSSEGFNQKQKLIDAKKTIDELNLAIESYKDQGKGLSAPEAAILITAICLELNQIPANGREGLAPIIEFCWGKSSSTAAEALRRKVTKESANKLANKFEGLTPKLARLIRELPKKLEEMKIERLNQINPNVN